MKLILAICCFMLTSFSCYASSSNNLQMSHRLGQVWKQEQFMHATDNKNDIAIVYGGKDISLRPSLVISKTTV